MPEPAKLQHQDRAATEPAGIRISCVVPATDAPDTLDRCLAAIRESEGPPDEIAAVTEPPDIGPAAARNAGAARGSGEVIVFVDADVLVHPDALSRIRAGFERDPALTALFGAYDDAPAEPDPVSGFRNLLHHQVHGESAGPVETFWTGLGAVRRDAFESVGGFDAERFPRPAMEDVDLGMRLSAAGHRIRLDPTIRGTHLKRWTMAEMVKVDFARRGVPWTRLLLERGRPRATLNLAPRHQASAAASVLVLIALVGRRPRLALTGILALVALNRGLYGLIWRRRGPGQAVTAVGLHLVHHLTTIAAAVGGVAGHLLGSHRKR